MAQSVPLLLRHQGRSHIHGPRGTPLIRRQASGRKLTNHSLQPHSHHLGKTHLTLRRNPLGLLKKVVGNLYLGFYHDGNLPASVCLSNAIQKKISPNFCAISVGHILQLTETLPAEFQGNLPGIDEIEAELTRDIALGSES